MTAQTSTQRSEAHRNREKAKVARMREALEEIAGDQASAAGCNPQIMRDVARKALVL